MPGKVIGVHVRLLDAQCHFRVWTSQNLYKPSNVETKWTTTTTIYLHNIVRRLATNTKHLKITRQNVCGFRNKVDEIQILLKLYRFDILGITETHLKSKIAEGETEIENYTYP